MNAPTTKPTLTVDEILVVEPFVRTKFPVLVCLFGFSGCGKTYSAIQIAKGIGGKTVFLDTETGRGRVYAEHAEGMSYAELTPPFTPERYIAAIKQLERAGFDNLIIDSASHEWDGLGGMLEIADANVNKDGTKKAGLGKWSVKSRHKTFMNTMMAGRMNIIICLRGKDKYVQEGKGPNASITMDGFVALQEKNFKYDMMIQLPMPEDGEGHYLTDKTKGFKCPGALKSFFPEGKQISEEMGQAIAAWVESGKPIDELLRQLKAIATEEAERGVESFRSFWKALPPEKRLQLTPYLPNFENIAKHADMEAQESEQPDVPVNTEGVDLRDLVDKLPPITQPADTGTTVIVRDQKDSDWWAVVDELEPLIKRCDNMKDLIDFLADNVRSINAISIAPPSVRMYWNNITENVQKGFTKKAA